MKCENEMEKRMSDGERNEGDGEMKRNEGCINEGMREPPPPPAI